MISAGRDDAEETARTARRVLGGAHRSRGIERSLGAARARATKAATRAPARAPLRARRREPNHRQPTRPTLAALLRGTSARRGPAPERGPRLPGRVGPPSEARSRSAVTRPAAAGGGPVGTRACEAPERHREVRAMSPGVWTRSGEAAGEPVLDDDEQRGEQDAPPRREVRREVPPPRCEAPRHRRLHFQELSGPARPAAPEAADQRRYQIMSSSSDSLSRRRPPPPAPPGVLREVAQRIRREVRAFPGLAGAAHESVRPLRRLLQFSDGARGDERVRARPRRGLAHAGSGRRSTARSGEDSARPGPVAGVGNSSRTGSDQFGDAGRRDLAARARGEVRQQLAATPRYMVGPHRHAAWRRPSSTPRGSPGSPGARARGAPCSA